MFFVAGWSPGFHSLFRYGFHKAALVEIGLKLKISTLNISHSNMTRDFVTINKEKNLPLLITQ